MKLAPRRGSPTLAAMLSLGAIPLIALYGVHRCGGVAAQVVATDPGVRVVGVCLVAVGWWIVRSSPHVAIGHRRLIARVVGVGLAVEGTLYLNGPGGAELLGTRCVVALAAFIGVMALYAWFSSPARRWEATLRRRMSA